MPWWVLLFLLFWLWVRGGVAHATPLTQLQLWEGGMDYFCTGAPLAVDTSADTDTTRVDALSQPASVVVSTTDVPAAATLVAAYLYWAGTVAEQNDCASTVNIDDEVALTLPGATMMQPVTADVCHCLPGAPPSALNTYDLQACRADITTRVQGSGMHGTYTVDEFAAQAENGSTDNASFSLVLIYEEVGVLPPRRIALYDGLEEIYQTTRTLLLSGLDVDTPAQGEITWYVLDGDEGGAAPEGVSVQGVPGGLTTTVSDALNPADNPMNHTINTTTPPQNGTIGVDIDRLDVSLGLTPGDTAVNMNYTAGGDKYWVVYNVVGINVFRAIIHPKLASKTWSLVGDVDGSGTPTPGDTVRYTIHVENVGTAPGAVTITDPIPAAFSSWQLVVDGGGTNQSTANELVLEDVWITAGGSVDIVLDCVVGPGTLGETVVNVAAYDTGDDQGTILGQALQIREALPDAGVPDAAVLDAEVPDASVMDADLQDSGSAPDAGGGGSGHPGCNCDQHGGGGPGPVGFLVALLLALWLRRSRPRRGGIRR